MSSAAVEGHALGVRIVRLVKTKTKSRKSNAKGCGVDAKDEEMRMKDPDVHARRAIDATGWPSIHGMFLDMEVLITRRDKSVRVVANIEDGLALEDSMKRDAMYHHTRPILFLRHFVVNLVLAGW